MRNGDWTKKEAKKDFKNGIIQFVLGGNHTVIGVGPI